MSKNILILSDGTAQAGRLMPDERRSNVYKLTHAGVHSDIGGSHPENESRLSDVALAWIVERATNIPHPIIIEQNWLNLFPWSGGAQPRRMQERSSEVDSGFQGDTERRAVASFGFRALPTDGCRSEQRTRMPEKSLGSDMSWLTPLRNALRI
ncbi:DUF2235 domain-containing protein [Ensifer aridi]|uniref:DUF2235 domain-containing protein n=1 Tax=Ensifer aridi TaxID=1708715 RepID=UPI001FCDC5C2|nr:DUF2235 domain-containing protein [Ensifer aridi]